MGGDLRILCAVRLCAGNQLLFVTNSTYLTAVRCRAEAGGRGGLTNCLLLPRPGLVWRVLWGSSVGRPGLAWTANCHRQAGLFLAGSDLNVENLLSPARAWVIAQTRGISIKLHFWVIGCVNWLFDQTIQMYHYITNAFHTHAHAIDQMNKFGINEIWECRIALKPLSSLDQSWIYFRERLRWASHEELRCHSRHKTQLQLWLSAQHETHQLRRREIKQSRLTTADHAVSFKGTIVWLKSTIQD